MGAYLDLGSRLAAELDLLPPPGGWGALGLAERTALAVYCGKRFSIGHVTEQPAKQIPILNKKTTKKLRMEKYGSVLILRCIMENCTCDVFPPCR